MTEQQQVWVFGGGGLGGIAWETGMLTGFADEGVTIATDATIIGTSAGSTVAAQVASGTPLEQLYDAQAAGVPYEISKSFGPGMFLRFLGASVVSRTPEDLGRRLGKAALAAEVGPPEERRAVIEARLPIHEWGAADLRIVAVDALSGQSRIIRRTDGVSLVDAVAASCAIPMVWPPVELQGRTYIDGGMRSSLNLDLAPGTGPVIALSPGPGGLGRWANIGRQRELLGAERTVEVITMSPEVRKVHGSNSLDKGIVPAVVSAGREQGRRDAARVRTALTPSG
jgi:NTE family protein